MSQPLVNFYELRDVRRHMDSEDDPTQLLTGINLASNPRILFCGQSGSGKTSALLNFIFLASQGAGTFSHIFLCCKTDEPLYAFLAEKLNHKGRRGLSVFKSLAEFPAVQEFADTISMPRNRRERYLCVFDDCINDIDAASRKKVRDFMAFSRKKSIVCAYLSQSFYQSDKFLRSNCRYVLLFSSPSVKDIDRILREFNLGDVTKEQLRAMFAYATQEPLNFLKIDTGNVPANRRFSRNFVEYLDPSQF